MADNVVRRDLVQIGWEIEKSPFDKIQDQTDKLSKTMKKFADDPKKLKAAFRELNHQKLNKLATGIDNVTRKIGTGMLNATKKAAKALGALSIAAGAGIFKLTDMASDLSETINKVEVAFGSSSGTVKKWAKNSIKDMGLAEQTALDMAAGFGDMGTGMGLSQDAASKMSMNLVQLGADLASFKNMSIDEVTSALNGVFTGETESLKRLGIVMTQTNLEDFAKSQGKTLKTMSESEKVMLRYEYVLSKTTNAQGDFARTGGGFANQLRMAKEQLKQIGTTIGGVFIGGFEKALQKINTFGADLNKTLSTVLADGFQFEDIAKIAPMLGPVGTVIQNIANKIRAFTSNNEKMQLLKDIFGKIKIVAAEVAGVIGKIATAVWDFVTSTGTLNTIKTLFDGVGKVIGWVKDNFDYLKDVIIACGIVFGTLAVAVGIYNAYQSISTTIQGIATAAQMGFNAAILACPISWIVAAIVALIAIIVLLVRNWDKVKEVATNVWNKIKEIWGKVSSWFNEKIVQPIDNAISKVKDAIVNAFQSAWDKVTGIWKGITGFFKGIWDGVKNIVNKIIGKGKEATGTSDKVKKHANGGLITRPHLGLVGEAGAEMIIPLSANRRRRGLSLWEQAGRMLGANMAMAPQVSTVSIPDYKPSSSVSNVSKSVSESNTYSPSFTLNMSGTVDRTTERTVKRWVQEALEEVFDSLGRTSPRVTEV